jgi:DNA-binding LacI/PurR family transcriptional regulator
LRKNRITMKGPNPATQPTMQDVADRAGVSRALVSLVMHNSPKVSPTRAAAVLAAAAELGYRPNLMARNLASRRTMTIGVLVDDMHNPYFHDVADGVQHLAEQQGFSVTLKGGRRDPEQERRAIVELLDFRVDGLVLLGPRLAHEHIDAAAARAPVVVVGRPTSSPVVDSVNNDEIEGTRLVVQHLATLGHRNIVHVDGGPGAGARPRRAGFELAMDAAGLTPDVVAGNFTEASGFEAAEELLRRAALPSAIFAANDACAIGLLDRFSQSGVRVPDDASVIGYDNTSVAGLGYVSLTSVDQPRYDMGILAAETLLKRLENPGAKTVHHVLKPTLVERRTTARPRSA